MNEIKTTRILRWVLACLIVFPIWALVAGSGIAAATEVYNESILFSGGGNIAGATSGGAGSTTGAASTCIGCIESISIDFTTYKQYSQLIAMNQVSKYGAPEYQTITLNAGSAGINNKYEPVIFTVEGGSIYGNGVVGWERTTGTTFNWVVYITQITNISYANTLTGVQNLTVSAYNKSIFTNFITSFSSTLIHSPINEDQFSFRIGSSGTQTFTQSTTIQSFQVSDTVIATFNNNSASNGYYNLSKGNANIRLNLTNTTGIVFYDQTSTNDVSEFEIISTGLIAHIYHVGLGLWVNRTIFDATGTYVPPATPPPPPIVNPLTGVGIQFDKSDYAINEVANISWLRTIATPISLTDNIDLVRPDGTFIRLVESPSDSGYIKTVLNSGAGKYTIQFNRCSFFCVTQYTVEYDTANISIAPSYIIPQAKYYTGVVSNVTYFLSPSEPNTSLYTYHWNDNGGNYVLSGSFYGTVSGIESNYTSFNCEIVGKYKFVLGNAVAYTDCVTDNTHPQFNITTSFLNITPISNQMLEYVSVEYAVDSINWTSNQTYIKSYDSNSILLYTYPLNHQYSNLSFFLVPATGDFLDMIVRPGTNTIKLITDKNITLASVDITVSEVDAQGYGLVFDKSVWCGTEKITFKYYAPDASNLTLYDEGGKLVYVKYLNTSFTGKTSSFYFNRPGKYDVRLLDSLALQKSNAIITINACEVSPTPTTINQQKATADMTLLLTSSFFWALLLTVGLMVMVAIELKNTPPIIPMVVTGFLSISGFTLIGWIPAWITFSIILLLIVIFAWQRAKDMNTAGE